MKREPCGIALGVSDTRDAVVNVRSVLVEHGCELVDVGWCSQTSVYVRLVVLCHDVSEFFHAGLEPE